MGKLDRKYSASHVPGVLRDYVNRDQFQLRP